MKIVHRRIQSSLKISKISNYKVLALTFGAKYSSMDQMKFAEDRLLKI